MTIINAFHPDYVQTYMPQFLSTIRAEGIQQANGSKYGSRAKATRESADKAVFTIATFQKTQRVSLAPKEIMYYSKAGTANTTQKKKK